MTDRGGISPIVARWRRASVVHRVATVLALASALIFIGPTSAHAGTVTDNLEAPSALNTWTFDGVGVGSGGIDYSTTAASGTHEGWLLSFTNGGWSSGGRAVQLSFSGYATCTASIHIRPLGRTTLNIEVINPATWNYIALKTVTIGVNNGGYQPYQSVTVGPWIAKAPTVFFRVSLLGSSGDWGWHAAFDDLNVTCNGGGRPL